jgi:hypothetical protein
MGAARFPGRNCEDSAAGIQQRPAHHLLMETQVGNAAPFSMALPLKQEAHSLQEGAMPPQ